MCVTNAPNRRNSAISRCYKHVAVVTTTATDSLFLVYSSIVDSLSAGGGTANVGRISPC